MLQYSKIWVVVKIMVPFWVLSIIWHLIFRGPKKGTIILTTTHMVWYSRGNQEPWVEVQSKGSPVVGLGSQAVYSSLTMGLEGFRIGVQESFTQQGLFQVHSTYSYQGAGCPSLQSAVP